MNLTIVKRPESCGQFSGDNSGQTTFYLLIEQAKPWSVPEYAGIIDLVLVGDIDQENLRDLTQKTEKYVERKIRTLVLATSENEQLAVNLNNRPQFLLWQKLEGI